MAGSASGELIVITPAKLTIGSVISDNGGATALTKAGSATLTLTGSNTYSGNTLVTVGTLALGNAGALQKSILDTSGNGVVSFGSLTLRDGRRTDRWRHTRFGQHRF